MYGGTSIFEFKHDGDFYIEPKLLPAYWTFYIIAIKV